ncbi:lactadherin-like [Strongylocentrotus purpuratus]|uniref:Uncharacterized protein n=1 Tax=Strongylocentrotus purpuratus TaxID=7668 RepID=A0A7M7NPD8_STRPU|nr:lactadherin-like [Strongylocentrotus purpuratus]
MVRLPDGTMLQTVPKLFSTPAVFAGKIPGQHIICRIPDCGKNLCKNGWCEETMGGYNCTCSSGFQGRHCDEMIIESTKEATNKPTTNPTTTMTERSDTTTSQTITTFACVSNPCQHGGTCEETDEGFNCTCLDGYCGDRCEYDSLVQSVRLVGGSKSEGRVVITSRSRPTTYMLIHQLNWSRNASRLVCIYLGYEDVYATVGGDLFEIISLDNNSEAVTVRCPVDVTNITDCWYEERAAVNPREESIAVVCCTVNLCSTPRGSPVGLESGSRKVPNSAISISSRYNDTLGGPNARLNSPSAWLPDVADEDPWLQIEFASAFVITAIMTQGRADSPEQWVTSYIVSSSMDGASWTYYQDINTNTVKVYTGNYDPNSLVVHTICRPIECRFFRIHPKTAHVHRALRLELTGYGPLNDLLAAMNQEEVSCSCPIRGEGMGVEDGRIPDSSLTSSSDFDYLHTASDGRLNGGVAVHEKTAWLAKDSDTDKWVKIDLGKTSTVTGVIVQGRWGWEQWITSVKVSYSLDDVTWPYALGPQCGEQKIYAANYDRSTPETILFPRPITARYVRIHPLTWIWHQGMRYEILGIPE